jgi:hypothetical protein
LEGDNLHKNVSKCLTLFLCLTLLSMIHVQFQFRGKIEIG